MPSLNQCDLLRHVGVNNFAQGCYSTATGRELNSQHASCKSNALATRLLSHPIIYLWCNGRLTEADTPTIRLGDTPSGLTSAHIQLCEKQRSQAAYMSKLKLVNV